MSGEDEGERERLYVYDEEYSLVWANRSIKKRVLTSFIIRSDPSTLTSLSLTLDRSLSLLIPVPDSERTSHESPSKRSHKNLLSQPNVNHRGYTRRRSGSRLPRCILVHHPSNHTSPSPT